MMKGVDEMGGACCTHGEVAKYVQNFGKPEGNIPVERPDAVGRQFETDLKEVGYEGVDWYYMVLNSKILGSCEHGNEFRRP
jgi:hypothetical protein